MVHQISFRQVITFIIAALVGCSTGSNNDPAHLKVLDEFEQVTVLAIDSILVFDTTRNLLLSHDLAIKQLDNNFLVIDKNNIKHMYRFDTRGRFLNTIASVGNAPGNIPSISCFITHQQNVEVLSSFGDRSTIYTYALNGELIDKKELGVLGISFECFNNGNYLIYSSYNYPQEKWRLYETDSLGNVIARYLKNDYKGIKYPIFENNLFKHESIYFSETFGNKLLKISPGQVSEEFVFDFGPYRIPAEFWSDHILDGFARLVSNGFINVFNVFENKDYILIDFRIHKEGASPRSRQLLITKQTHSVKVLDTEISEDALFAFPTFLTRNNQIGYLVNPAALTTAVKEGVIQCKGCDFSSVGWNEYDNPVVIFTSIDL